MRMGSEDGCYMRWVVGASLLRGFFLLGWGSEDVCVLRVGGWMDGTRWKYIMSSFSLFLWLLWIYSGPYTYFYPLNIQSLGYHPLTP